MDKPYAYVFVKLSASHGLLHIRVSGLVLPASSSSCFCLSPPILITEATIYLCEQSHRARSPQSKQWTKLERSYPLYINVHNRCLCRINKKCDDNPTWTTRAFTWYPGPSVLSSFHPIVFSLLAEAMRAEMKERLNGIICKYQAIFVEELHSDKHSSLSELNTIARNFKVKRFTTSELCCTTMPLVRT